MAGCGAERAPALRLAVGAPRVAGSLDPHPVGHAGTCPVLSPRPSFQRGAAAGAAPLRLHHARDAALHRQQGTGLSRSARFDGGVGPLLVCLVGTPLGGSWASREEDCLPTSRSGQWCPPAVRCLASDDRGLELAHCSPARASWAPGRSASAWLPHLPSPPQALTGLSLHPPRQAPQIGTWGQRDGPSHSTCPSVQQAPLTVSLFSSPGLCLVPSAPALAASGPQQLVAVWRCLPRHPLAPAPAHLWSRVCPHSLARSLSSSGQSCPAFLSGECGQRLARAGLH